MTFGVVAPLAAQRASFQKNRLADFGAVVDGEAADIEDQALQNFGFTILDFGLKFKISDFIFKIQTKFTAKVFFNVAKASQIAEFQFPLA